MPDTIRRKRRKEKYREKGRIHKRPWMCAHRRYRTKDEDVNGGKHAAKMPSERMMPGCEPDATDKASGAYAPYCESAWADGLLGGTSPSTKPEGRSEEGRLKEAFPNSRFENANK